MSAFKALQAACEPHVFKSLKELSPGEYEVEWFKLLPTKYGIRMIALLGTIYYFLPRSFSDSIKTQQQIDELNECRYKMKYFGKDPARNNRIMLEFTKINTVTNTEFVGIDTVN
jgi:hypothetical protein